MLQVKVYCINRNQPGQYFGLKLAEQGNEQVLTAAPNNWKTERGAVNWAKRHGYEVVTEPETETDMTDAYAGLSCLRRAKKEYWFFELGFFLERDCRAIKEEMDGKTYMNFNVVYSNCHGNCTLGVETDYDETEEKIKNFFLNCVLGLIFELKHGEEEREKNRRMAEEFYRKRAVRAGA